MKNLKTYKQTLKKYVYKYDNYYWYCDDVEGDLLVKNIEDALILSEKRAKEMDDVLLTNDVVGSTMWCDDTEIEITHPMEKIEV